MLKQSVKNAVSWLLNIKASQQAADAALKLYEEGKYKQAQEAFTQLVIKHPHQEKFARSYLGKISKEHEEANATVKENQLPKDFKP